MTTADAPAPDASRPSSPATRRICWPNPDATCLQGGCVYCHDEKPRSVATIERYARRVGTVPHRCTPAGVDALAAFRDGEEHGAGR